MNLMRLKNIKKWQCTLTWRDVTLTVGTISYIGAHTWHLSKESISFK